MPDAKTSPQYVTASPAPYQLIVIGAGVATTIAALIGVYYLNARADVNAMGWYIDYLLPAGAMLVGLVAGSGYGIASWLTGQKIRRRLLLTIIVLQLLAYAGARYVEFVSQGPLYFSGTDHLLTFPEYFNFQATHFAWKQENGKTDEPLGEWGYFFTALQVAGFALGALIVPAALFKKPYCETCQAYMRTRRLALVAASVPYRKVKKSDAAGQQEYTRQQDDAYHLAQEKINALAKCGAADDVEGYRAAAAALAGNKKTIAKLPMRIAVKLIRCRRCDSAYLQTQLLTGQGKKLKTVDLQRMELPRGFASRAS